jgi:PadR family transcriptional regulator, regulatory protein PadR
MHGYAISESIQQRSEEVLKVEEGALYPALHRLQVRGYLAAEWGTSENNRRAKYYRLTATGRARLVDEAERWNRLTGAIGRIMQPA